MLWSDPHDDASPESRRAQQLLRRGGRMVAVFAVVIAVLLML